LEGVQTVEEVLLAFTFKRTWHKQEFSEEGGKVFFGVVEGFTWTKFYCSRIVVIDPPRGWEYRFFFGGVRWCIDVAKEEVVVGRRGLEQGNREDR
jgi:hypothetical protein